MSKIMSSIMTSIESGKLKYSKAKRRYVSNNVTKEKVNDMRTKAPSRGVRK